MTGCLTIAMLATAMRMGSGLFLERAPGGASFCCCWAFGRWRALRWRGRSRRRSRRFPALRSIPAASRLRWRSVRMGGCSRPPITDSSGTTCRCSQSARMARSPRIMAPRSRPVTTRRRCRSARTEGCWQPPTTWEAQCRCSRSAQMARSPRSPVPRSRRPGSESLAFSPDGRLLVTSNNGNRPDRPGGPGHRFGVRGRRGWRPQPGFRLPVHARRPGPGFGGVQPGWRPAGDRGGCRR